MLRPIAGQPASTRHRSRAALLALALFACSPEPGPSAPARERAPLVVTRGALEERVLLTGELEAVRSQKLSAPATVAGRLSIQWLGEDGAEVAAGERVVEFDNSSIVEELRELELQEVQAETDLVSTRAQATIDEEMKLIEVEKQRALVAKAELDARIPRDMIAKRDWRQYQLSLEQARSALETASDELEAHREAARHEERVKQIALEKIQRKIERIEQQLGGLVLTAPRDGILVIAEHPWRGRKFQIGDNAWPSLPVAKVPDLSEMQVSAGLSDVDDGRIAPGMPAVCVLDAWPDERYECEVISVSPVARELSEDSRRRFFDVKVALSRTNPEVMRPGMSVRVEVIAKRVEDAVIAPRAGIDLAAEPAQAVLAGGGRTEVEIDFCTPRACAALAGLEEGAELRPAEGAR